MPRNGSGVASAVPGSNTVSAGNTILSALENSLVNDLISMLNTAWPVSLGGTGGTTPITAWDAITAKGMTVPSAATLVLSTVTGPYIDISGTTSVTAVTLADGTHRLARATGIFTLTASASLLVNKSASVNYTTAVGDLMIFTAEGGVVSVTVIGSSTNPALTSNAPFINFSIGTPTVAASALTVPIKGADGNDPSATNIVYVNFRSATTGSGAIAQLAITAATSIVISSGSTMGFTSGVIGRLWLVGFNDAGTFRLGLVNALSSPSIMALRDGIYSSTAEGGSGGADSAQVIYTGTAVTSKAMTVLGYLEATEATAGTWATAPSLVQVRTPSTPLPGDEIQSVVLNTGAVSTGTTTIPYDDTLPQNTEGTQFMAAPNISAVSGCNLRHTEAVGNCGHSVSTAFVTMCLFQDSAADALATALGYSNGNNGSATVMALEHYAQFLTTTAQAMKIRIGSPTAGTITFNGASSARLYGGSFASNIRVSEIMA